MDSDADDREPISAPAEPDPLSSDAPKTTARKAPARKPAAGKAVQARPASAKTSMAKTPVAKTPAAKAQAAKAPAAKSGATAARKAPVAKPPVKRAPATKAPAAKVPAAKEPVAKTPAARTPARKTTTATTRAAKAPAEPLRSPESARETVLVLEGLSKHFDTTFAVDSVSLSVSSGTIFGIVGPNGAGKTTTLSMVTGLLRPDAGTIHVHGADVWSDPVTAKRNMGVLPDRLRLFDRLTGSQLLYYAGILRGLSGPTVKSRSADLAVAFGLEDALDRLVADYSAGMTKKIALAAAMIHSPRLLILDEPFESVDPVSAANVIEILQNYTAAGGTVVMSSHSMDLIQRVCDSVAIIVGGKVLVSGTMEQVRGTQSLEARFVELAGGRRTAEGMEWLHSFSD